MKRVAIAGALYLASLPFGLVRSVYIQGVFLTGSFGADHAAATARFRDLGLRFWLAVSLLEHAEALTADGRGQEAEPLLHEAREILTELGARPWLDRAEAISGRRSAEVAG